MKLLAGIVAVTIFAAGSTGITWADTPEKAAESSALTWLAWIDAGNYDQSWVRASKYFRDRITQPQWVSAVSGVRAPLGGMKERSLLSEKSAHSLPGAPDGDYVVIQFSASFEKKAAATETVTEMKDVDGRWRVAGYFIK